MLLAGLAMFIAWSVAEFFLEHVLAGIVFSETPMERWSPTIDLSSWSAVNSVVNNAIALLNCTVLIWLYASLRPMYGVGTRTALITSAFGIILGFSLFINFINLGLFPARLGLLEALFASLELLIAMIVGATVYEGEDRGARETA
jgi:hypothetical protein